MTTKEKDTTEEPVVDETKEASAAESKKLAEMSLEELAAVDRHLAETRVLLQGEQNLVQSEIDRRHILLLSDTASKWSRARYPEADAADPVPEEAAAAV